MRDYWICPNCRCALDNGERCDCKDRTPIAHCFTCSIPLFPADTNHYADQIYEIQGHYLCEDCVDKFVRQNCKAEPPFVTVPNDYGTHKDLYYKEEE